MRNFLTLFLALFIVTIFLAYNYGRTYWFPAYLKVSGHNSVRDIEVRYGLSVTQRLKGDFVKANLPFPPRELALIAYKDTKELQLWGRESNSWVKVKVYPIKAASGVLGPKLREGDRQVPEGVYEIESLNPNSSYHLSMKLNYPNEFDQRWAKAEGRSEPGTNIFIHGKAVSIGCLAMGDDAIEELFLLTARLGRSKVKVIISPSNPHITRLENPMPAKPWVDQLYLDLKQSIESITGDALLIN